MRLWTVQPARILEELERTGVFRCDPEQSYNLSKANSLKDAYQWLMRHMEAKIGPRPEGVVYPIWAWHTWEFLRQAPEVNSAAFLERTEDKVLLTLDIPEARVVLTDFDAWQTVMNDSYVSDAETEEEYDALQERLDALTDEELEEAIAASRENVFKLSPIDNDFLTRGRFIQATFWEIRKEDIVEQKILTRNA